MGKLLRTIFGFASNQPPIDPARFGDPLALKTEWTPATKGGSNFRTHRFIQTEFTRAEFKASGWAKVFYTFFALVGIGFVVTFVVIRTPPSFSVDSIMPILVGAIFTVMGSAMLYAGTAPIIFDKGNGYFWKGRKGPEDVLEVSSLKKCARLDQIHAIQLVSEFVRSGKSAYYSYELNLVLEDARRITVIDHGNLLRLQEDAKKLSDFLGKPVWDAVEKAT
jgi:hypothetical protein